MTISSEPINTCPYMVSIIVLAYNHLEYTKQCIESIFKYTNNINYELIVVDNGSSDGTLEYFNNLTFPNIRVVRIEKNRGAANGYNKGIEQASGKYTVMLNNDLILTHNWLSNLLKCIQWDNNIGMVVPTTNNASNFQSTSCDYKTIEELHDFSVKYNISDASKWQKMLRLVTYAVIVPTELLKKLNGFDEANFISEFADDDLSFRIRRLGYKLICAKDTFIHHFCSVTTNIEHSKLNSLEKTRIKFIDKFNIDPWTDASFDNITLDSLNITDKKEVNILGINQKCGSTPLQLKNMLKEKGINHISIFNYTDDNKYVLDLKTVSDYVFSGGIEDLFLSINCKKFDYILLGKNLENYSNELALLNKFKNILSVNGQLALFINNEFYYENVLNTLNLNSSNELKSTYFNPNLLINALVQLGFKNPYIVSCVKYSNKYNKNFISALKDLTSIEDKESFENRLYIYKYLIRLEG